MHRRQQLLCSSQAVFRRPQLHTVTQASKHHAGRQASILHRPVYLDEGPEVLSNGPKVRADVVLQQQSRRLADLCNSGGGPGSSS